MKYFDLDLAGVKRLARHMAAVPGNKHRIIGLVGPLGAGKTTFTKAFAAAMGIRQAKSPTFVVVHRYQGRKNSLYHIDLYRLDKASQLPAVGLDEILTEPDAKACIEWVDKFPPVMKKCDTIVRFDHQKNNLRHVTVTTRKN